MDIVAPSPAEMEFTTDGTRDFQGVTIDDKDFCAAPVTVANSGGDNLSAEQLAADEQPRKRIMETDDSADAVPDTILTEMKEQMLKEVEDMKGSPSLAQNVVDVVPEDIEKLLNPKSQHEESQPAQQQRAEANDKPILRHEQQEEGPSADPDKIGKAEIKAALEEIKSVDVLVCGNCHLTTNFIEEFMKHRTSCKQKSPFVGGMIEQKPTIWAFLLYKHALVQQNPQKYSGGLTESSWKLYQKWCKMPEEVRNTWVVAGESVMNYVSLGNFRKDASKVLPSKGVDKPIQEDDPKRPVIMKKFCQRDQSGEMMKIRPGGQISTNSYRGSISEDSEPGKNRLDDDDSRDAPPPNTKKKEDALREEEFVVERIVSRRFNPRRKQYEYLLKWEGYPPEQNTWEPAENLEACQHLLKAFEESLNKQAMHKLKNNSTNRKHDYNLPSSSETSSVKDNFGRPTRSSKQKALSQVKQWCGSIKPDEEIESLMKHKMSPADSDDEEDFMSKRFRMGSDSEESLGGRAGGLIKKAPSGRGPGRPRKYPPMGSLSNGTAGPRVESSDEGDGKSTLEILSQANVTKTLNLSPANQQVLVANAKGVVKVDPAQVPNLSSGVYIMSNKSGIIKLDSVSPSKALSMKQGIVKDISPTLKTPTPTQTPIKSVVMLNKNQSVLQEIPQKSGIVRKTQLMSTPQPTSRIAATPSSILPGAKTTPKPTRPTGSIKINTPNPNTRFLHSGANRSVNVNPTPKPKTIIRSEPVLRERMLNPPGRVGRGGILAGSLNRNVGARSGTITSTTNVIRSGITKVSSQMSNPVGSATIDKGKVIELPKAVTQPSASEPSLPATFPADMPHIAPASLSQSLTLCPETGNVVLKTENPITSDHSSTVVTPAITTPLVSTDFHEPIVIKEEYIEKAMPMDSTVESEHILTQVSQQQQQPLRAKNQASAQQMKPKESLVKRTLGKPGSIGSMTVSPQKILPEVEDPESDLVTISGDDGMIYKVSKAELNNSLLSAGDEQQCIYLTTGENGEENATVITLDPSTYSEQVNQLGQVNVLGEVGQEETTQYYVKDGEEGELMDIQMQGQEAGEEGQSQLVAQLVEAGEPEPGVGTRKVVLLLPDGNLMMTEVDEEQYAALELDKVQGQTAEME